MKILIGTPIHVAKDYSMQKWINNVSEVQKACPSDLLLIDNSPNTNYVKKAKSYCSKYKIKNYEIRHLDFHRKSMKMEEIEERIETSQIMISKEVLAKNYDAWFSWECDVIIPPNTLNKLTKLMIDGNFMIIAHNFWFRGDPSNQPNHDMGVTLINRECLEKYSYNLEFVTSKNYLKIPDNLRLSKYSWFAYRVYRSGGNFVTVDGLVEPIIHLKR